MTFRVGDIGGLRLNEEETVILLSNLPDKYEGDFAVSCDAEKFQAVVML